MNDSLLERTKALRDEAFRAVAASPAYMAYQALENAVAAMGGETQSVGSKVPSGRSSTAIGNGSVGSDASVKRVSQPDAAAAILRERGSPAMGWQLLEALPSKGASVSPSNPTINFTSAMSKSGRFQSVRHDGNYYWWFKDEPLPSGWNEAKPEDFDGLLGPASSLQPSQETANANNT